jgi:hypothetical protein
MVIIDLWGDSSHYELAENRGGKDQCRDRWYAYDASAIDIVIKIIRRFAYPWSGRSRGKRNAYISREAFFIYCWRRVRLANIPVTS